MIVIKTNKLFIDKDTRELMSLLKYMFVKGKVDFRHVQI
jgi:hypothetical protein